MVSKSNRAVNFINDHFMRMFVAFESPLVGIESQCNGAICYSGIPGSVADFDLSSSLIEGNVSQSCAMAINFA